MKVDLLWIAIAVAAATLERAAHLYFDSPKGQSRPVWMRRSILAIAPVGLVAVVIIGFDHLRLDRVHDTFLPLVPLASFLVALMLLGLPDLMRRRIVSSWRHRTAVTSYAVLWAVLLAVVIGAGWLLDSWTRERLVEERAGLARMAERIREEAAFRQLEAFLEERGFDEAVAEADRRFRAAVGSSVGIEQAIVELDQEKSRLEQEWYAELREAIGLIPEPLRSAEACAAIEIGATELAVGELLGRPIRVDSAERSRGPGAVRWYWTDPGCEVFLQDGVVESFRSVGQR